MDNQVSPPEWVFALGVAVGIVASALVLGVVWLSLSSPRDAVAIESGSVALAAAIWIGRFVRARLMSVGEQSRVSDTPIGDATQPSLPFESSPDGRLI